MQRGDSRALLLTDSSVEQAPKVTRPRGNVVIRLCSIECNFAQPLTDPSNEKFQQDMQHWASVSNRTFIWNYITNFQNFIARKPLKNV